MAVLSSPSIAMSENAGIHTRFFPEGATKPLEIAIAFIAWFKAPAPIACTSTVPLSLKTLVKAPATLFGLDLDDTFYKSLTKYLGFDILDDSLKEEICIIKRNLEESGIKSYLLGGELKTSTEAMVGSMVVDNLKNYNFTKCFLGTNGIHKEYGYTTPDIAEAIIKKEALNRSFMSCVLADSSKFGIISPVAFGKLAQACIITDNLLDKNYLDYTIVKEV